MGMLMDAIETCFDGHRFRSRTEARWSVFFKTLRMPYLYEPEGFALKSGYYLPDFYLPKQKLWLEIKPMVDYDLDGYALWPEDARWGEFADYDGGQMARPLIVLCGTPKHVPQHDMYKPDLPYEGFLVGNIDDAYFWTRCQWCRAVGITYNARSARVRHRKSCEYPRTDKNYNADDDALVMAFRAASEARFEHGEEPIIPNL